MDHVREGTSTPFPCTISLFQKSQNKDMQIYFPGESGSIGDRFFLSAPSEPLGKIAFIRWYIDFPERDFVQAT